MAKLLEITGKAISGEWGQDDDTGTGIPVLRTTNFTNEGFVNYKNVVTRSISKKNIAEKYLRHGDVIIEKSGGSDKQPVGRVIFFEGEENKYLFNNFTGLLRVQNPEEWLPKYVFYALYAYYRNGGTRAFENRTTGLHNLQVDNYVKSVDIPKLSYRKQQHICETLDHVRDAVAYRERQLTKLDELVKARFVEMFGDVISNSNLWPICKFSEITSSRLGKMLDAKQQTGVHRYPYLANFNVQWFRFELKTLNSMDFNESDRIEFELHDGDLLVCEGGEIGRCAVWHNNVQPCYFQKALHRVRCNKDFILPDFLAWWFKYNCDHGGFSAIEGAKATIAHLPGAKLKNLDVCVPPLPLQNQFATFVEEVDKSKVEVQKALDQTQLLFDSLMQQYFG